MKRRCLVFALPVLQVLIAGELWTEKKAADWTAEERERILTHSPWAKTVAAGIDVTKGAVSSSRRSSNGRSVGLGGRNASPEGLPELRAVVRWESAAPIREAEKKPLPEGTKARIVLSVTMTGALSTPGSLTTDKVGAEEELLRSTSLQGKGKLPMNPDRVWQDEKTGTVYFLFGDRDSISADDKEWVFETSLGSMALKAKFVAREMHYLGKPSL